jgi:catechol-2,3-dioxygenase
MTTITGADKRLTHLVLKTAQLPAMRDWYLRVLDAHVVFENNSVCFMTFDSEHHRLGLIQLPPNAIPRTPMSVGLAHSAYTYKDLETLLAKYEALAEAGIAPHVPVQHGPTTSIYYRDPDGNLAELQIDNMTPDEATAYLDGDEYGNDPMGPSFDPETMLAALRSGTSESELVTRTWASTCPQLNVPELLMS